MRHEHMGCWNRPHGPLAIGETIISIEGNELVIRVKSPRPLEPWVFPSGVAVVDVKFDDELWD